MVGDIQRNCFAILARIELVCIRLFQNSASIEVNLPVSGVDETDRRILRAMQSDGRLSNAKLSETLALSETPCWRRLRRLEAEGYIKGYHAHLNRKKLGFGVVAFAQVTLGNHAGEAPLLFEQRVADMPEVLACHNVTGDCDYLVQIVAENLEDYGTFVRDQLRKLPGVTSIQSYLSLREVKSSSVLPV